MSSVSMADRLAAPIPPTPIPAIASRSLGAVCPGPPRACRGTMVNPAAAAAAVFRKSRREAALPDTRLMIALLSFLRIVDLGNEAAVSGAERADVGLGGGGRDLAAGHQDEARTAGPKTGPAGLGDGLRRSLQEHARRIEVAAQDDIGPDGR